MQRKESRTERGKHEQANGEPEVGAEDPANDAKYVLMDERQLQVVEITEDLAVALGLGCPARTQCF